MKLTCERNGSPRTFTVNNFESRYPNGPSAEELAKELTKHKIHHPEYFMSALELLLQEESFKVDPLEECLGVHAVVVVTISFLGLEYQLGGEPVSLKILALCLGKRNPRAVGILDADPAVARQGMENNKAAPLIRRLKNVAFHKPRIFRHVTCVQERLVKVNDDGLLFFLEAKSTGVVLQEFSPLCHCSARLGVKICAFLNDTASILGPTFLRTMDRTVREQTSLNSRNSSCLSHGMRTV